MVVKELHVVNIEAYLLDRNLVRVDFWDEEAELEKVRGHCEWALLKYKLVQGDLDILVVA